MSAHRLQRKLRKLNSRHLLIAVFAVLTGYGLSLIGNSSVAQNRSQSSQQLTHSAVRLAEAFELYNQKRFAP